MTRRLFMVFAFAWATMLAGAAHAQTPPDEDTRARAAEHFDRGIEFYNEGRYDAALAEFSQAYSIAPAPEALYNLARVHAALGHAVESADAYSRYLTEGGHSLSPTRRREAEHALADQESRVGGLDVRTDVQGATISIDGVDVATAPLVEPIRLAAGTHNVEVRAPAREPVRSAVAIAGRAIAVLNVTLRESVERRGTLRVTTSAPEVTIAVDGEQVGVTPLGTTVPLVIGRHVVTASRPGYRTQTRQVTIEDGAQAELEIAMVREPRAPADQIGRMRLQLPNAPYLIRVDGEVVIGLELELPIGAHHIELEVTDRQPYQGSVRIQSAASVVIAPPLAWTLDARQARLESASTQRTWGIALTIVGLPLALAGIPVAIWNETEISTSDARLNAINDELSGCWAMPGAAQHCMDLEAEGQQIIDHQSTQNVLRAVFLPAAIVGTIAGTIGIVLWATAPSDQDIDRGARASLRLGPGSVELTGAF